MIEMTYEIEEVNQIDIQKLGGIYSKYPVSKIVADIIYNLGSVVVDTTYGRGRFYAIYRPLRLIGIDVKKWDWIVKPDVFYNCAVWDFYNMLKRKSIDISHTDIVVVDPPKWHNKKYKRDEYNYIVGTPKLIIYFAYNIARELNARFLLLHYNEILKDIKGEIVKVIKFRFSSRYSHVGHRSFGYFVLYDLQKQ
jgi:hypothetical protein